MSIGMEGCGPNPRTYSKAEYDALHAEAEALRGLTPELPPRPPEGAGLPRYGLRWNGPAQPLSVPMDDGYWTPWHLAEALRAEIEELDALCNRQSDLLSQAAIALRGPEPALTRYNHADIPLRVKMVVSELDAARGLLRDMRIAARINPSCQYGMVNPCRCGYCVDLRVDAFLTATQAPEAQDHIAESSKMAEQGERQEAVAWVEVKDRHEGPYEFHGIELLDSGKHNLYAAPIAQTAISTQRGES